MAFIIENTVKSSLGILDRRCLKERYQSDFIDFHRKDLDWLAFVTILFNVNVVLIFIDEYVIFTGPNRNNADGSLKEFPLRNITYQLLVNHFLQMIFLRNFYDENRKVNTKHRWVWYFHIFSYAYIIYVYGFTNAR